MMNKILIFTALSLMSLSQSFASTQENFFSILSKVQNAHWKGHFKTRILGTTCEGPLHVQFFPVQVEDFSNGVATLSYRHHADFSGNVDLLCSKLVASFSPVDVGHCGENFPMKFNPDEGRRVPFRTIIPKNNGESAVTSSPSCNRRGEIERQELNLSSGVLSPDGNALTLTITIKALGLTVDVDYVLKRQ